MDFFRLPAEKRKMLQMPNSGNDDCQITKSMKELSHLFHDGNHFVLQSFFEVFLFLQKNKKKFSILLRTFGKDAPAVLEEMK